MKGAVVLCDSTVATGNGPDKYFNGGKAALIANGTFGGGSVKLQMKVDIGGTAVYYDVPSASLSAAGYFVADLPPGTYRSVSATGTGFFARLVSIPQS